MKNIVYSVCAVLAGCCFALSAAAESGRDIKRIENTFNNYDENKNGKVTRGEFLSFWESKFMATDRNEDGVLDQTEVLHARGFQARDANKDGVIELDEAQDRVRVAARTSCFRPASPLSGPLL